MLKQNDSYNSTKMIKSISLMAKHLSPLHPNLIIKNMNSVDQKIPTMHGNHKCGNALYNKYLTGKRQQLKYVSIASICFAIGSIGFYRINHSDEKSQ